MKMPKRQRQFDEPSEQPFKKQAFFKNDTLKVRNIKSSASEKTINMLFEGALRYSNKVESTAMRCICFKESPNPNNCYYCNKVVCKNCTRSCDICQEYFCANCSLLMNDEKYNSVCLSCINGI